MRIDGRPRVAFDTGIFDAGLFKPSLTAYENLCPVVGEAARRGAFRLILLDAVFAELSRRARRQGWHARLEGEILGFLDQGHVEWPESSDPPELEAERIALLLRHQADVAIAVEVKSHRPDFFVHTNKRHWGGHLNEALGGVQVVSPRGLPRALGLPVPPRRRR